MTPELDRRSFLKAAGVVSVAAACGGGGTGAPAPGPLAPPQAPSTMRIATSNAALRFISPSD